MCNRGPDTNGSLFQVTFRANPDMDNKYVVFGCLASDDSYEVLGRINNYGTDTGEPVEELIISDSGIAYQKRDKKKNKINV
jgi:cyclophilin family peptidyl-prolyl cis-trans isomerase